MPGKTILHSPVFSPPLPGKARLRIPGFGGYLTSRRMTGENTVRAILELSPIARYGEGCVAPIRRMYVKFKVNKAGELEKGFGNRPMPRTGTG